MAPIYVDKKTNRLYIEFQYRGHRHKERLPEGTTKEAAKKIEVKVKNDLMFQSHGIATSEHTFDQFIDDYFGEIADKNYCHATWVNARHIVKVARPFFKGKSMRSIKAADIERFKSYRISLPTIHGGVRKPATVEREMAIISRIFTEAVKNDVIDYNPCHRVTKLQIKNVQNKVLHWDDEPGFFANMHSEWARDVCRMALYTGLRQNDIMTLTRFKVDRKRKEINLVQGKTKMPLVIPLNSVAMEIIDRRWHNGHKLLFASPKTGTEKGSVRHAMQRACKRAGIPVITIRDLRRTNATRQIEAGNDYTIVAQNLGHSDVRMIHRYVRSMDAQRKASDSIVRPMKLRVVKGQK